MTTLIRPYRGVSPEARTADRRARLLVACLDVIGREGVAATTVGAVCEAAGLTKRYFYESFADRDALLGDVLDGLHSTLHEEVHEALAVCGPAPLDRCRETIRLLVGEMDDPRMARLYVEAAAHPVLAERRQAAYQVYARLVATEVHGLVDPSATDLLSALVFVTGTTQAVISWLQGGVDLTREQLIEELAVLGAGPAA